MLSYFQPAILNSSSSNEAKSPERAVTNMQQLTEEQVKALKFSQSAVSSSQASRGKGKNIQNTIVSKCYNSVASRPLRHIRNKEQIYSANLRYDLNAAFTTSTTVPTYFSANIILTSFLGYAQYTGLFDQYMIDQLEAWLEPVTSQATVITNVGEFASAIDLDDATTPSSFTTVEDKQNALVTGGFGSHYHKWKPHIAVAVYQGTFVGFENAPATWIDSGSPQVQHYGLKVANTATSTAISYNVQFRARILFKQAGL